MNNSVRLQNFEKLDIMNNNLYTRNIPSRDIQPNFDPRPVSTKYSTLPLTDHKKETNIPIIKQDNYNSSEIFYPGTRKPNYSGFATNIDKESTLRNQFFALQAADQANYIPSSTSDLYMDPINKQTVSKDLDETLLFKQSEFADFYPNPSVIIGNRIFDNATRVQLKNLK
tara:strand:- start:5944 stop:6453 length:510 start_codon:yes stop_codon:yes gene_type:complete